MIHTPPSYWDQFHQRHVLAGKDLDWGNHWTGAFIDTLRANSVRTVLDLGCGTGNDVVRLADAGFQVTGLDYSTSALKHASTKEQMSRRFVLADMAHSLPFATASFDAVMSNVALHMFSDTITRAAFIEVQRIVRGNGLFVFHLNSVQDRLLRKRRKGELQEIEPDYVLEGDGQTMHYFSEEYLRELLANWSIMSLERVAIPRSETRESLKQVWRGVARKA